jgi:hypothetical protein
VLEQWRLLGGATPARPEPRPERPAAPRPAEKHPAATAA